MPSAVVTAAPASPPSAATGPPPAAAAAAQTARKPHPSAVSVFPVTATPIPTDVDPTERAQALRVALRHQLHMKLLAVVMFALGTLPVLVGVARVFNDMGDRLVARHNIFLHTSSSQEAVRVALDGSPELLEFAFMEIITGCGTVLYVVIICIVAHQGMRRVPKRLRLLLGVAVLSIGMHFASVMDQWGARGDALLFLMDPVLSWVGCALVREALAFPSFPHRLMLISFVFSLGILALSVIAVELFFSSSEGTRIFLRLVFHPLLGEAMLAPCRFMSYAAPPHLAKAAALPCMFVYYLLNCFGRLQVATMGTAWGTTIVIIAASVQEVLLRTTVLDRDRLYARLMCRPLKMMPQHEEVKALLVGMDQLAEDTGIMTAAAATILWRLSLDSGRVAPDAATVVQLAALQLLVEVGTDLFPTLLAFSDRMRVPLLGKPGQTGTRWNRRALRIRKRVVLTAMQWNQVLASWPALLWVYALNAFGPYWHARIAFIPLRFMCMVSTDAEESRVSGFGGGWWQWTPCDLQVD